MLTRLGLLTSFGLLAAVAMPSADLRWDGAARGFTWTRPGVGAIVVQGRASTEKGAATEVRSGREGLVFLSAGGASLRLWNDGGRLMAQAKGAAFALSALADVNGSALPAILRAQKAADRGVLTMRLGDASTRGLRSLYDPGRDLALDCRAGGLERSGGWMLRTQVAPGKPVVWLEAHPGYYRNALGIAHYEPIAKRRRWPTAPAVAMTWYGIEAWSGRPAQTLDRLLPEIDWVALNLRPYAGDNLVFQLDDNYPERDDAAVRALADAIRARGLVPGVWFTPFCVAPKGTEDQRPDWFLKGPDGAAVQTFGGVNFGGAATLDVANAEAVRAWYGAFWRKVSDTWDFDFFKIDGQPEVIEAYRKARGSKGVEQYREGLRAARDIVGRDKFINGCWGTPLEAIGRVDGSRTGPDTGLWPHATDVVIRWNFLNNVAWYCDPDAAANQYKATPEVARLNAQARALTGQQFLTDDLWTKVPPAIARIWQRCLPTLDIHPANLYRIEDWRRYDLFDLRVAKGKAQWSVVGLFHYDNSSCTKRLDLARLGLDGTNAFFVYDFWRGRYLGRYLGDESIPMPMAPYEGKLFAVAPDRGAPTLLSTNRHVSQGGLDLDALTTTRVEGGWKVMGRSSHLVKGDPYRLTFAPGAFRCVASSPNLRVATDADGVTRATLQPVADNAVWWLKFAPRTGAAPAFRTSSPVLKGSEGYLDVVNLGDKPSTFQVVSDNRRVKAFPPKGSVLPGDRLRLHVSVDCKGLLAGESVTGQLRLAGVSGAAASVEVAMPPPPNLALKATATASSEWDAGFAAKAAADDNGSTRWNSARGDASGAWMELTWPKPVRLNRVVVDECTDWGERIQAWRLEAGDGELAEVARGSTLGPNATIELPNAVSAARLRLVIEKASDVPTVREMRVFDWPKR